MSKIKKQGCCCWTIRRPKLVLQGLLLWQTGRNWEKKALIWSGCVKELALPPCLCRAGFHFQARCLSIILFGCFFFCDFGSRLVIHPPMTKTWHQDGEAESFTETIRYVQTRNQFGWRKAKIKSKRCRAEWIWQITYFIHDIFCIILFSQWYSQRTKSNIILKNTLHHSLCFSILSPFFIFFLISTKNPNVSQGTDFFWLRNIK